MAKRKKKIGYDDFAGSGDRDKVKDEEKIDLTLIQNILNESFGENVGKPVKNGKEMLIPVLQKAQEAYGYIPRGVINEINVRTGIATSKIHGVVTFYDEFSTEKRGKYTLKTCCGTACQVRGGKQSTEAIKKRLGVDVGETTADYQFSLEKAGCLGACAISPAMLVNKQLYGRVTQEKIVPLIDQLTKK